MSVGLPHGFDHRAEKSGYRLAVRCAFAPENSFSRTDPMEPQPG
jgi:hypothetical protein